MTPRRVAWFAFGAAALGIGALGVVTPLLPTTPFVLLAAFAFARSSDNWHAWLVSHAIFGPMIRDWRAHGAISRRAKAAAVLAMAAAFVISMALDAPQGALVLQAIVLAGSAIFVLSRPHPRHDQKR
jgi:uncharacterized membrane protein YbaN (DUF454 family)